MAQSQWVVEATEANFQDAVVERSRTVPVVVDFWQSGREHPGNTFTTIGNWRQEEYDAAVARNSSGRVHDTPPRPAARPP